MTHEIYRISSFEKVAPFTLRVHFDDGTSQVIDFRPVLKGEMYGPLQDPTLFDQVRIDPEINTLVWPNGADFDPAILHNWPESGPALQSLAEQWSNQKHSVPGSTVNQVWHITHRCHRESFLLKFPRDQHNIYGGSPKRRSASVFRYLIT